MQRPSGEITPPISAASAAIIRHCLPVFMPMYGRVGPPAGAVSADRSGFAFCTGPAQRTYGRDHAPPRQNLTT